MLCKDNIKRIFKCSPMQKGMFFLYKMDPSSKQYIVQYYFELKGTIDLACFQQAFHDICDKYDVLRTIFIQKTTDYPIQIVLKEVTPDYTYTDLSVASQTTTAQLLEADLDKGFQIDKIPCVRVHLVRESDTSYSCIFTFHHILMDGWCNSIIINDFLTCYAAQVHQIALPVQPVPQYESYINWIDKQDGFLATNFWKDYLKDYHNSLKIPFLKDQKESAYKFNNHTVSFSKFLGDNIEAIAKENTITINAICQLLWGIVLARINDVTDIVFGIVSSGRPPDVVDSERILGLFINTIPIRITWDKDTTIREVLKYSFEQINAIQNYNFLQLADIQQLSEQSRNLIDHIFIFENYPKNIDSIAEIDELKELDLQLENVQVFDQTNYDFNVIAKKNEALEFKFLFNEYLISIADIEVIGSYLKNVLHQIIENQDEKVSSLQIMTEETIAYVSGIEAEIKNNSLPEYWHETVLRFPEETAVTFENEQFKYTQIDELSDSLAHYLQEVHAVKKGDRIVVTLERSEKMIVAVWSILKIGATIVPMDVNYPENRKNYILNDCNAACIINEKILTDWYSKKENYTVFNFDPNSSNASTPCYVIYTSGTTGNPNGTIITHGNLINLVDFHDTFSIKFSKVLQFAPLVFDVSFQEILCTLLKGGNLFVIKEEIRYDTEALFQFIEKHQIGTLFLPTSFLKYISITKEALYQIPQCIDDIIVAGERLIINTYLKEFLLARHTQLHNHYGPSEAHVVSTLMIDKSVAIEKIPSIGRPIQNTSLCIVSENGSMQAKGGVGELLITGKAVGKGYINNEALTAKKFIQIKGQTFYRTGDKAAIHNDDTISYFGRIDDQVKYRGYRIELGETEATIIQNKTIKGAVVVLYEEADSFQKLVTFIITENDYQESGLLSYLNGQLPHYMVPTEIIHLEKFPMTHNGKIDKKLLKNGYIKPVIPEGLEIPPTPTEEKIITIWESVLTTKQPKVEDNFLTLGGHSLQFIQLAGRYAKSFKVEVSFQELFHNATVKAHAELIASKAVATEENIISKTATQENYPLSSSQKRMWTLNQFENADRAHNVIQAFEFKGTLVKVSLEKAFLKVLERHEILRAHFLIDEKANIYQRYIPTEEFKLSLAHVTCEDESSIRKIVEKQYTTAFDLEKGPLWNVVIAKLSEEHHILILSIHHIICDGWSMQILAKEVLGYYYNFLHNDASISLPELSIQYKDYVAWLEMPAQQERIQKEATYWKKKFEGEIPVLQFPATKKRPALKTYNGESCTALFSKEVSEKLYQYSANQESTLFMTLLAGLNALLFRYTNQTDIIIGTPTAGRIHKQLEDQIGLFLNTLAVRNQFDENISFKGLTELVKTELTGAYSHQFYPFDMLVDELNVRRDLSRSPLFDILIVLQNQKSTIITTNKKEPGLTVSPYSGSGRELSMFDLKFIFQEYEEGIHVVLEFNSDIYTSYQIQNVLRHFETLLSEAIQQPKTPIHQLKYLSELDLKQALSNSGHYIKPKESEETIISTFKKIAEKSGSNNALIRNDKKITYSELDALSDQFALYLKTKYDIRPYDTIAIILDRNEWVCIAMLSILKLGCAFVPIDINAPTERTAFILNDSKSVLEITTEIIDEFSIENEHKESIVLPELHPDMASYIIYTSGTTGKPKGVLIPHKALVNYANWFKNSQKITAEDSSVVLSGHAFDLIYTSIFGCLLTGATLYIPSETLISDLNGISNYITENNISFLKITPMYLNLLLAIDKNILNSTSLQLIVCGGEQPIVEDIKKIVVAGKTFLNHYGPTETTIGVCAHKVTKENVEDFEEVPVIGKPIDNTQLYILDANQQVCGDGIIGEICIAGIQLANGYVDRTELSKEKFSVHKDLSKRIFRTGDLGKRLSNGTILYVGRKDNQVKIRGYRIELEDIEQALASQKQYLKSAAVLIKEKNNQKMVVAFVVAKSIVFNEYGLKRALKKQLPAYMIPEHFVELEEMPLNANGKIDRKALAKKNSFTETPDAVLVYPSNQMETALAAIIKKELGHEKISIKDNFFDLGANSLLLIKLLHEINTSLSLDVQLLTIFQYPTVESLTIAIEIENESSNKKTVSIKEEIDDDDDDDDDIMDDDMYTIINE